MLSALLLAKQPAGQPVKASPASTEKLIDSPAVCQAGPGPLSLALMDARNHTLQLLAHCDEASRSARPFSPSLPNPEESESPARIAGRVAWLAEWWLVRNPQRRLGSRAPADAGRFPPLHPQADAWFGPDAVAPLPELDTIRSYMLAQLESTLELLQGAGDGAEELYLFRAMLHHEDVYGERLVAHAQSQGIFLPLQPGAAYAAREPLLLPATRWLLGSPSGGFTPSLERPQHPVDVPAFEIDAQPVTWAQYTEFVCDGGYDRPELWHPEGWRWLEKIVAAEGRRCPRYVEQMGVASSAVMQTWFGRPTRLSAAQPVMHVTWWEADAWARWAGRRLPTEVEWDVAAHQASSRGFRWGEVLEWTVNPLRPWDGFTPDAWSAGTPLDPEPWWGRARVLRGGSIAARTRQRYSRSRRFALPAHDQAFTGFRTCAL